MPKPMREKERQYKFPWLLDAMDEWAARMRVQGIKRPTSFFRYILQKNFGVSYVTDLSYEQAGFLVHELQHIL